MKQAADAISKSRKPVIIAGGGVISSGAAAELKDLAETAKLPVTMTMMGLGGFPGDHKLSLGMLGMHGTYFANMAVHESDLLIAIGMRFDDRVTGRVEDFAPNAKIIHIDIDPTSIRKNVRVDVPIVGDVKNVLKDLNKTIHDAAGQVNPHRKVWLDRIEDWKAEHPMDYDQADVIKPQFVVEIMR